jgi:hypothetical protein
VNKATTENREMSADENGSFDTAQLNFGFDVRIARAEQIEAMNFAQLQIAEVTFTETENTVKDVFSIHRDPFANGQWKIEGEKKFMIVYGFRKTEILRFQVWRSQ